ncbi:MAG: CAP domain-containing protein [Planctomycetes bacterium]|nr:CAP domain-containing protein [Planctomycetota bacterium]
MKNATRQLNKATYLACIAIISLFACLTGCDILALIGNPIPNDSGILTDGQLSSNSSHDATELEQLALERINHARLWPAREAELGGITVDEGIPGQIDESPKQAVAMNNILRAAANAHSEDMLVRDYFAHRNPDGDNPGDRVRANGYVWNLVGENLAWNGTTASLDPVEIIEQQHDNLFIDREIENRGHRLTMLHDELREVGISIVRGALPPAMSPIPTR